MVKAIFQDPLKKVACRACGRPFKPVTSHQEVSVCPRAKDCKNKKRREQLLRACGAKDRTAGNCHACGRKMGEAVLLNGRVSVCRVTKDCDDKKRRAQMLKGYGPAGTIGKAFGGKS